PTVKLSEHFIPFVTPPPTLPPWGRMEAKLEAMRKTSVVPIDWQPVDGPVTMKKWKRWREDLITAIDSMLWPRYHVDKNGWDSNDVAKLLDADFQLLGDLSENLGLPIKGMFPTKFVHGDFFKDEDDGNIAFGSGYERYDPTLAPVVHNGLPTVLIGGIA